MILCTLLTIGVAWLFKTVIDQGQALVAARTNYEAKSCAHESSCVACKAEMGRRIDDTRSETDRRFGEITASLKSISDKLDRALRDQHGGERGNE
jgi:hypothetical protein